MRVLQLTTHFEPGGISSYILSLAAGLKKAGVQVAVASSPGRLTAVLKEEGIPWIEVPLRTKQELSLKVLRSYRALVDFLNKSHFDLIHSHTRVSQVVASLLARRFKIQYLTTCHGFFRLRLGRRLFPLWGEAVIAISPQVREHLVDDWKLADEKVRFIPHGIDTERFHPAASLQAKVNARRELGLKEGLVAGIIARFSSVKGHEVLLKAWVRVRERFPQAQLLMVGEGKEEERIKRLISELGLESAVVIRPTIMDTRTVLWAMDVFVQPSLQEGLGLAILEAQACGVAVVASRVGGIPALIEEAKTGLLAEPGDHVGLAEAIMRMFVEGHMRNAIQGEARQRVERDFSQRRMIEETARLYRELLPNEKV
jgi:glycosyltransferase involved in cell wall biosynthesis